MRILCLSDEYPWPATSGYRLRLANVLRGLADAGTVDLFAMVGDRPDLHGGETEPPAGVRRLSIHAHPPFGSSVGGLLRWTRSQQPRAVAWSDWSGAQPALARWAEPRYDAVWFSHLHTWLALGDVGRGPAVIDLDNLENEKLRTLMRLRNSSSPHDTVAAMLDRVDVGRWARAQRKAARHARLVVCSELDRARLGVPSAFVIPNGYDYDGMPAERPDAGDPVLTMVALFVYAPNHDGARFFAREVLPLVRRQVPNATLRLVGRHDGVLDELHGIPGVEIAGEVELLDRVFADTAAVVVPLRAGGGTRIKVLEAFARGLPVVTTTLGCEGLDAEDGTHCLIADTPAGLAAACVRILTEPELAAGLAQEGRRLWEARYRWQLIRPLVAEAAREVAA